MTAVIVLSAVAILEFGFIVYQDLSTRKEREKLQLKLMSKNVEEYQKATEEPPEETEDEPDPYKPVEDVPTEKLMRARDKL